MEIIKVVYQERWETNKELGEMEMRANVWDAWVTLMQGLERYMSA